MITSSEKSEIGMMDRCANCRIPDGDNVKLKECGACHLVKYCGVKCQKQHRQKHKRACKKRAAELHDEILFRQPHVSHFGDCPICCLPLHSAMFSCCMKMLCKGCYYTNLNQDLKENGIEKCPFCRTEGPKSLAECEKRSKDRADKNDPFAMHELGLTLAKKGDYEPAFHLFSKAANLGYTAAHHELSIVYGLGHGQQKDEKKELFHREQAAIGGHPVARYNLGFNELETGQVERAIKHFMIAAKLGFDLALEVLQKLNQTGLMRKEDYDAALEGHKAAVDAAWSVQREEAAARYSSERLGFSWPSK